MRRNTFGINAQRGRAQIQEAITITGKYDKDEIDNRQRINALNQAKKLKGYQVYSKGASTDRDLIEIQKYELVYMCKNKSRIAANNGIGASSIPVLSTLNGAYHRMNPSLKAQKLSEDKVLAHNVEFVGIALTDANNHTVKKGNRPVSTTTIQIAGLNSITNNGVENIIAGDLVAWKVPDSNAVQNRKKKNGLSPDKVVLQPLPYKNMQNVLGSELVESIVDAQATGFVPPYAVNIVNGLMELCNVIDSGSSPSGTPLPPLDDAKRNAIRTRFKNYGDETNAAVMKIMKGLLDTQLEYERHIIGRATSSAAPGEDFDIYLTH